jgi:hypothetical protein
MIYVDAPRPRGAPWPGGRSAHLVSDSSAAELCSFAASIGMQSYWYQSRCYPHFDLSPRLYRKALAAGAVRVDHHGLMAALTRLCAAAPPRLR